MSISIMLANKYCVISRHLYVCTTLAILVSRHQTISPYDRFVCHDNVVVFTATSDHRLGRWDYRLFRMRSLTTNSGIHSVAVPAMAPKTNPTTPHSNPDAAARGVHSFATSHIDAHFPSFLLRICLSRYIDSIIPYHCISKECNSCDKIVD